MPTSAETIQLLTVLQWPKVGPAKLRDVVRVRKPNQDPIEAAKMCLPPTIAAAAGSSVHGAAARQIVDACESLGIAIVSMCDADYPPRLREISDPPPIIYAKGALAALQRPGLAVVGTRRAGRSGARAAALIAGYLVERGLSVISGLALGIDAAGHVGALDAGGVTLAVLAHGLDTVAPRSNRAIADRLLGAGGALVSEHPPGVPPRPAEFARRNRIQSGLSQASIIVESGAEGGAMIQAAFARDQGRPILTVLSRQPSDLNTAGAERLIVEFGAQALYGTADLGVALGRLSTGQVVATSIAAPLALEW